MPLSCPIAPPSNRELSKDGGAAAVLAWRGGRAPPGPQRPSPAPRPMVRPTPRPEPRPLCARPSRVSQGKRGGRHARTGCGLRRWKVVRATMSTFTLPSSAAPRTSSVTSCVTSSFTSCVTSPVTSCAASFTCSSFTCRLRGGAGGGRHACVWNVPPLEDGDGKDKTPPCPSPPRRSSRPPPRPAPRLLALHVLTTTATEPAAQTKGFER